VPAPGPSPGAARGAPLIRLPEKLLDPSVGTKVPTATDRRGARSTLPAPTRTSIRTGAGHAVV